MTNENPENRRKFQRVLFDADTKIEGTKGDYPAELIDISLNGVLIQRPDNWTGAVGDEATITIKLDSEENFKISMQTRITHAEQNHIGLHCEHIDMESITHLRRLVELNLGDEDVLERELEALG